MDPKKFVPLKYMENTNIEENKCCPKFDPALWDNKQFVWQDKLFIKEIMPQFLHMPLPWMIGKMITRMTKQAQEAQAFPKMKDFLWLAYDPSPWKSENFIHVAREVPDAENVKISGSFMTKVFDGPYNAVPKWIKEMDAYVASQGKVVKKYYFYYTTCPKCAKIYGHNYVVTFAEVE